MPPTDAQRLRAIEAAALLAKLVPGAEIELAAGELATLEALRRDGLVAATDDPAARRETLARKKAELLAVSDADTARQRTLRSEILDLSEALLAADGAVRIRSGGADGPYRGARRSEGAVVVTQRGRALASNLLTRVTRAPEMPLGDFETHLRALDDLFALRAQRTAELFASVQPRLGATFPAGALRSAMAGLATLRAPVPAIADAFVVLATALRHAESTVRFDAGQDASAAETLLLHVGDPSLAYRSEVPSWFVRLRNDLCDRYCEGRTEDALDASLLLASVPGAGHEAAIARAASFATAMAAAGVRTPLSLALLATAGGQGEGLVPSLRAAYDAILPSAEGPLEALATAVLVTAQSSHDVPSQLARVLALHGYLARIAPRAMLVPAALLALLDGEPAGVLDDLRLVARQVTERRAAPGGGEATSVALKLLLHAAMLAGGREGDVEESLPLALRALPGIGALALGQQGLGTVSATLPMLATTVATFHRPMLDAAAIFGEFAAPMHSSSVFTGGAPSFFGGGGGYHHHRSHRSIGWG